MAPPTEEDIEMEDENYASSEDPDFAPENAPDNASADSDDEGDDAEGGETTTTAQQPSKASKADAEAEDAGFENSGDEAIIGKGKKKRRRDDEDGEDGGAGGFVKTRNQRANEKAERRVAAAQGPVTVDVDALFMQMMGGGGGEGSGSDDKQPQQQQTDLSSLASAAMFAATAGDDSNKGGEDAETAAAKASSSHVEMIKIKRTYNFAGEVHTEVKIVARDSAEAKLYLEQVGADNIEIVVLNKDGEEETKQGGDDDDQPKRLPPRKAFRSAFEPILDPSLVQIGARTDLDLGLAARLQARERSTLLRQQQAAQDQAKKLTTVEKSRMDWAGFVDREGIQDELALAGKSKGAFVDRQSFLARTEMRREEEARRARMSGKV